MSSHNEPEPLTSDQLDELTALLKQRREETLSATERGRDNVKPVSLDEPIGRLSRVDAMQQRAMAQASRRQLQLSKVQIDGALRHVEQGSYGDCRRCEEPIGYRRLKSRPEAPFCLACQSTSERR